MTMTKKPLAIRKQRIFEDFISTYYKEYTKETESPNEFHVWTAISIICGALGPKCFMDFKSFKINTNMYLVMVAPPGIVSKSTTMGIGYSLLKKVPGINFGADSGSWQALIDTFVDVTQSYKVDGYPKLTSSAINMSVGELGTLLRTKDEERMDTLVRLWDVPEDYVKRTRGEELFIENPWMNMMGATTPSWVEQNLKDYAIGGGFSSRTLFVYADKKARLIPHPNLDNAREMDVLKAKLIHDLTKISKMSGNFSFDDETREVAEKWYVQHNDRKNNPLWRSEVTASYAARKQSHLYKICMAVSASRGESMVINLKDFKTALSLLNKVEENLCTIFVAISEDENLNAISYIVNYIKQEGRQTQGAIKFALRHRFTAFNVARAIENALASQQLRVGKDDMDREFIDLPRKRKAATK